jgi:hypothetical protein
MRRVVLAGLKVLLMRLAAHRREILAVYLRLQFNLGVMGLLTVLLELEAVAVVGLETHKA